MGAGVGQTSGAWIQLWEPLAECTAALAWSEALGAPAVRVGAFDAETSVITITGTLDGLPLTVHAVTRTKIRRADLLPLDELQAAAATETALESNP